MKRERMEIGGIPCIWWGQPSDRTFLYIHGKMGCKENAALFAALAEEAGYQTLSFDLPAHGERMGRPETCDIWTGKRDLTAVADEVFRRGRDVSLFACSLGAYFSLQTYADRPFRKCLFQSPVVDMRWLVEHMILWSNVTEEMLREKREIETEIDTLRWDYYSYILAHPVEAWPVKTFLLYGALDELQPLESIRAFADRFHAALTVSPASRHPFMDKGDEQIVTRWIQASLHADA